jgi:CBS domain-containing protein
MLAKDIMTRNVFCLRPDSDVCGAAKLLVERNISAAPVVDETHRPIGMVSEGDLMKTDELRRNEQCRQWLERLAEGNPLHLGFVDAVQHGRYVRDIMKRPVISVGQDAEIADVARLMETNNINRVVVVKSEQLLGLVSRWDIVRAVASERTASQFSLLAQGGRSVASQMTLDSRLMRPARLEKGEGPSSDFASAPPIPAWLVRNRRPAVTAPASPDRELNPPATRLAKLTAARFRAFVHEHEVQEDRQKTENRRAAIELRKQRIKELAGRRLTDQAWREMLDYAQRSAMQGMKEHMLIRFPSELCSDGGRAINAPDQNWPATLRGEPADIFARWTQELKPAGFQLAAQIIDFPDGLPGDAALFLIWGA